MTLKDKRDLIMLLRSQNKRNIAERKYWRKYN